MLRQRYFLKINVITIGSVLALILIGSIVRSMGAGMGCPDWPKCFGQYIPPTDGESLPDNYLEVFKEKRVSKNRRLASMLTYMGFDNAATRLTSDPKILEEEYFSVTKAWVEYINRLVGVLIGFLVTLNMVFSFAHKSWSMRIAGVGVFLLTVIQGWLGSIVVSTNLLPGLITFHMLMALFILALLIYMHVNAKQVRRISDRTLLLICIVMFVLYIPQIVMGTEVRGLVDMLKDNGVQKSLWLENFTVIFSYHRSYSWAFLVLSIALLVMVRRRGYQQLQFATYALLGLVFAAMFIGLGLTKLSFPAVLQPPHLLVATLIFANIFYLILRLRYS
ncbi:MAG: COX15/CtaA family protein [Bacteroidota bacterium]